MEFADDENEPGFIFSGGIPVSDATLAWEFLLSCTNGTVPHSECGPAIALEVIAAGVLFFTATLLVLIRSRLVAADRIPPPEDEGGAAA